MATGGRRDPRLCKEMNGGAGSPPPVISPCSGKASQFLPGKLCAIPQKSGLNKWGSSMPCSALGCAVLIRTYFQAGSNQFLRGWAEQNRFRQTLGATLSLIRLSAAVAGARRGALRGCGRHLLGRPERGVMNAPRLLVLPESLITANWEGQFKQAQRSRCAGSVTWV